MSALGLYLDEILGFLCCLFSFSELVSFSCQPDTAQRDLTASPLGGLPGQIALWPCLFWLTLENELQAVGFPWGLVLVSFITFMKHFINKPHLDMILCKSLFNPPAFLPQDHLA